MPARPSIPAVATTAARVLLLALALLLPLIAGRLQVWQTALVGLLVLLAAALALLATALSRPAPRRLRPEDLAWVVLLALMTWSVAWAPYLHGALLAMLALLSYALCFWLARDLLGEARWRQALPAALVLGGALVGGRGWWEYWTSGDASWRIFVDFFNPNLVAAYLLVCLPVGAALALRYWRPREGDTPLARPLAFAAVVLMLLAFPLTGSKGGALGALAAAVVFAWAAAPRGTSAGRRLRWGVLTCVGLGILLGLALPPLRARVTAAFTTQSNSTAFRYYTWLGMLDMIRARPLQGWGPGSFEWVYPRYAHAGYTRLGHESYLQVATEAGLPGLAAYLALWVALSLALARRLREATGEARLLPAAAAAALAGFLVHNLVDYSWYCPAVTCSLFLLLGAALAPKAQAASRTEAEAPASRVHGAAWIGAALCLLLVFVLGLTVLPAQHRARTGSLPDLRAAVRDDPLDADLWDALAGTLTQPPARPEALRQALALRERQIARLRPSDPRNWRRIALLYGQLGDLPAALDAAAQALRWHPTYLLGLATQARLAERAGDLPLATQAWRRLSDLYDTPVGKYAALGDLPDPTYLFAWDFLARRARQAGDAAGVLDYRRRQAGLLARVLSLGQKEQMLLEFTNLLPPGGWGELQALAGPVAADLEASGSPPDAVLAGQLRAAAAAAAATAGKAPPTAN